jgi:hypothetical protein
MRNLRASVVSTLGGLILLGGALAYGDPQVVRAHETSMSVVRSDAITPTARERRQLHRRLGLSKRRRGPCAGMYAVVTPPGGPTLCSHGPDPIPAGIDGSRKRTIRQLRRAAPRRVRRLAAEGPHGIPCVGNGQDGYRVQAIYARYAGSPDRSASVIPLIRAYVPVMDRDIVASASQTGGERHLRWVTNADCSLRVIDIVVDADEDVVSQLEAMGYVGPRRKYHLWLDAPGGFTCGYGTMYFDDREGATNDNETEVGYGVTYESCWFGEGTGLPESVEIHEIWHTLGAVQDSAPNATGLGHCTDEYDVMCYEDGSGQPMRSVCAIAEAPFLDCGDDDYFHVAPAGGAYLRSHLNTADSVYLTGSLTEPPPTPQDVAATAAGSGFRVSWRDVPGEDGYRIECRTSGTFETCQGGIPGGTTSHHVDGLAPYTLYDLRVCALGGGGDACSDAASARTLPPTRTVDDRSAGFKRKGKGWKSQRTGYAGRSYWRRANTSPRGAGTWTATVPPGTYEVLVFVPRKHVETWSARYVVFAASGKVMRKVPQGILKGSWVSLGKHRFGGTAKVKLGDRTGEGFTWDIAYDALRFVPVSLASAGRKDRAARR